MCESSFPEINPAKTSSEPSIEQKNEGSMNGGQQGLTGDRGIQIQGSNFTVSLTPPTNSEAIDIAKEVSRFGNLKSEDQKYDGRLVRIVLNFFNYSQQNQQTQQLTGLLLDISFGEVEENYIEQNKLGFRKQERPIRFGIKFGELCLKFTNKYTLFNLLNNPEAEKIRGRATSVGTTKTPKWQFKAESKLEAENSAVVLFGTLLNQKLGSINFLNSLCEVEATFQVSGVNSNNLGITEQDGLWDDKTSKKVKETKIRTFFKKVVEPKLKDYVSKVVLQYDSAVVS